MQPYVADFESHEEAYNQTISNYEAAQKRSMLMNMQEESQAQIQDQAPERSQDR